MATITGETLTLKSTGLNLNQTGDVASFTGLPASIVIDRVEIKNWSTTPGVLLTATLRDAAAGAGNSLVGTISGLNAIVTATALAAVAVPFVAVLGASRVVSTSAIYLNVSAANGSALTGDLTIFFHLA